MTQAHVEATDFHLNSEHFENIHCQLGELRITCHLNSNISLVLERRKLGTHILIRSRTQSISVTPETFDKICDSKRNLSLLRSYIEDQKCSL